MEESQFLLRLCHEAPLSVEEHRRLEAGRSRAAHMLRKWCEHCGQCEMGQMQEVMRQVPR